MRAGRHPSAPPSRPRTAGSRPTSPWDGPRRPAPARAGGGRCEPRRKGGPFKPVHFPRGVMFTLLRSLSFVFTRRRVICVSPPPPLPPVSSPAVRPVQVPGGAWSCGDHEAAGGALLPTLLAPLPLRLPPCAWSTCSGQGLRVVLGGLEAFLRSRRGGSRPGHSANARTPLQSQKMKLAPQRMDTEAWPRLLGV